MEFADLLNNSEFKFRFYLKIKNINPKILRKKCSLNIYALYGDRESLIYIENAIISSDSMSFPKPFVMNRSIFFLSLKILLICEEIDVKPVIYQQGAKILRMYANNNISVLILEADSEKKCNLVFIKERTFCSEILKNIHFNFKLVQENKKKQEIKGKFFIISKISNKTHAISVYKSEVIDEKHEGWKPFILKSYQLCEESNPDSLFTISLFDVSNFNPIGVIPLTLNRLDGKTLKFPFCTKNKKTGYSIHLKGFFKEYIPGPFTLGKVGLNYQLLFFVDVKALSADSLQKDECEKFLSLIHNAFCIFNTSSKMFKIYPFNYSNCEKRKKENDNDSPKFTYDDFKKSLKNYIKLLSPSTSQKFHEVFEFIKSNCQPLEHKLTNLEIHNIIVVLTDSRLSDLAEIRKNIQEIESTNSSLIFMIPPGENVSRNLFEIANSSEANYMVHYVHTESLENVSEIHKVTEIILPKISERITRFYESRLTSNQKIFTAPINQK